MSKLETKYYITCWSCGDETETILTGDFSEQEIQIRELSKKFTCEKCGGHSFQHRTKK